MRHAPQHHLLAALLGAAALVAVTTGCSAPPPEVPDDAMPSTAGTESTRSTIDPSGDAPLVGSDEMTRLITLCLARYGLSDRPAAPAEAATADERLIVQQRQADYDATLTDCSAEAMAAAEAAVPPAS